MSARPLCIQHYGCLTRCIHVRRQETGPAQQERRAAAGSLTQRGQGHAQERDTTSIDTHFQSSPIVRV